MPVYRKSSGETAEAKAVRVQDVLRLCGEEEGAIAAKVNGIPVDLNAFVPDGAVVEPILASTEEGLDILRHSASHLMAQAIKRLYPGTKLGIGPAVEDGFYYDVDPPQSLTEDDLQKIEEEMGRIVKEALPVERIELPRDEVISIFKERGETYKLELIEEIEDPFISLYRQGEFIDLCRGPHVPNTSYIRHFKLLSLAGAYWRGDERNTMLVRVYGTAFPTAESLRSYLDRLEEAKRRDHRKLGRELDLFSIQPEGPGFPFFHPKGMTIVNVLLDFWRREHVKRGYMEVRTPLILEQSLWIRSGHWDHYRENMYFTEIDGRPFAIKPMNCPGSILIYKSQLRSYRDLPLRMAELGTVHRHERSGVLHGLMRVRCFTQDDAHLYVTEDQIKSEILGIMDLMHHIYGDVFGFPYRVELSTRPENAMGELSRWEMAESALKEALDESGTPYKLNPGDGAFYGPKIDFHLEDCIGRSWQCGTIQLDFQMPEKFDVTYVAADGSHRRPVMLHRTVLGSIERFLGILIEHYAGAFPYWLAPVQIRILPVKDDFLSYAREVETALRNWGVRTEVDLREEKLSRKIRDAQLQKVPYMLVVGAKEAEGRKVSVRERTKGDLGEMDLEGLKGLLNQEFNPF